MALKRPFSELDWQLTPEPVRQYIMALERTLFDMEQRIAAHEKRLEKLEVRTRKNSHNSSKPPSSDPPFARKKRKRKKSQKPKGGQKGHKAAPTANTGPDRKPLVDAETLRLRAFNIRPRSDAAVLRASTYRIAQNRYGRQPLHPPAVRLPQLRQGGQGHAAPGQGHWLRSSVDCLHWGIERHQGHEQGRCEAACANPFWAFGIATGTIQKLVDRTSKALLPVYERIGFIARKFWCNYIDETSWFKNHHLHWLWAMVNERVAFYRIDPHRSKQGLREIGPGLERHFGQRRIRSIPKMGLPAKPVWLI
jgi:transposase